MDNEILIKQLKDQFSKWKSEMKFKTNFEEVERVAFVSDLVLKERFVSPSLPRQICGRIANLYTNWAGYLHSLIMPNPQNILNLSESKLFSQEEKKEIHELMSKAMEISSRNGLIGLTKDKKEEAKFIDDAIELWNNRFEQKMIRIMKKVNDAWRGEQ